MRRLLFVAAVAALLVAPLARAWTWPSDGAVLQGFSFDPDHPYAAGQHRGIDIAGSDGATVVAPAGGTVTFAGSVPSSGKTVSIETGDYTVTLTHLGSTSVSKGASVNEGDAVGTIGSSGYVQLGIRTTSNDQGYLDPMSFLPARVAAPPSLVPAPAPDPAAADPAAPADPAPVPDAPVPDTPAADAPAADPPTAGAPVAAAPPVVDPAPVAEAPAVDPPPAPAPLVEPPAAPARAADAPTASEPAPAPVPDPAPVAATPVPAVPAAAPTPVAIPYDPIEPPATIVPVEPVPVADAVPALSVEVPAPAPALPGMSHGSAPRVESPAAVSHRPRPVTPPHLGQARPHARPVARPPHARPRPRPRPVPHRLHDLPLAGLPVRADRPHRPADRRSLLPFGLLAGVAPLLLAAWAVRKRVPTMDAHALLRDHTDLLRERPPAHRSRLHDDRGGHPRAPSPAAWRGDVLPHRRGRARHEGVARR